MVHYRIGMADGVSLEMEKWKTILEKFGHKIFYLTGDLGSTIGYLIPELAWDSEVARSVFHDAFMKFNNHKPAQDFIHEITERVGDIKIKIMEFLIKFKIDLLIVNNMFSLTFNLPASIALYEVIKEQKLPAIFHHHDFHWENKIINPTLEIFQNYLETVFPPDLPNTTHVVINTFADQELLFRRSINAVVIPNVFYFEEENWIKDEFNKDFREKLQIDPNDIVFLQATRIVPRKAIELVIDVISELNKPKNLKKLLSLPLYDGRKFGETNNIVLMMPNLVDDLEYQKKIEEKMNEANIKYVFCNDLIAPERIPEPNKKYSLWDTYVHADIVSYPSLWEGWGNQYLEAVKAKLPIIVYEYPVYLTDIKYQIYNGSSTEFENISFGSKIEGTDSNGLVYVKKEVINKIVGEVIICLTDKECRDTKVNNNYEICLRNYSMKNLEKYLASIMRKFNK